MKYSQLKQRIKYLHQEGFEKVTGGGHYNVKRYYDLNGNRIFGLEEPVDRSNLNIIGAGAFLKNEAIANRDNKFVFTAAVDNLLNDIDRLIKAELKERAANVDEGQEVQSRN